MLKKRFGLLPTQQPKEVCWKNRQQLVDRNHAVFSKIEKHIIVWIQSLLTVFSSFILSCSITFFCLPCFLVHIIIRMSNKILEKYFSIVLFMPLRLKIMRGGILCLSCLSFCNSVWYFNLADNVWTVSARALIFHLSISCNKTFPWVPTFFTLWPWNLA